MPSIPQSLLWISLVVLWLFVLVPMLISKRDAVRRTSDVALATRVLNSGTGARLLRRRGPATGHRSDPDWRPSTNDTDDTVDDLDHDTAEESSGSSVVLAAADASDVVAEPDYLDVDVVDEDSGALPVGASAAVAEESPQVQTEELPLDFDGSGEVDADETQVAEVGDEVEAKYETDAEAEPERESADDDEYEYVADSSGLEAPSEADLHVADSMSESRRRRYESKTSAAVAARKYKFRKRMLMVMTLVLAGSVGAAYTVLPGTWWVVGSLGAVTLLYLVYLRRQTRIEERMRKRRAQRLARSRLGVENTDDREFDVVPSRLRRPGSVVLEIDDEDPIFEHLDYTPFARHYDLPHAAGQ
jgi:hypothetical protein